VQNLEIPHYIGYALAVITNTRDYQVPFMKIMMYITD